MAELTTPILHENIVPDVPCLIEILAARQVRYVIVGSVAAQLYGLDVQPDDFDITPDPQPTNLTQLAHVLRELEASLPDTDEVGQWEVQADGEKKWVSRTATLEERRQRAAWVPMPDDISTYDALFYTHCGNLDIVPDLIGDYEMLLERAKKVMVRGIDVWVAHVDELLAALTVPRWQKDGSRVRQLRDLQRQSWTERRTGRSSG